MLGQTRSALRHFPPVLASSGCSICRGTGWELVTSRGPSAARRCACVALKRALKLKEQIRIPETHEHCTLENFRPYTTSQSHALAEAWAFTEHFPGADRGIIFLGGSKSGKTHLAVGIALELVRRYLDDILFVDFHSLLDISTPAAKGAFGGRCSALRLESVSLLVLDNIGARSASAKQYQTALQLLGSRMRHGRPTICTGSRLERFDNKHDSVAADAAVPQTALLQLHALLLGSFRIIPVVGQRPGVQGNDRREMF